MLYRSADVGAEYGRQNFDDDGWSSESDDGRHPTQITRRPMHKWEVRRRPGVPIVVPSRPMLEDHRPTGADHSTPVWLTTEDIDAQWDALKESLRRSPKCEAGPMIDSMLDTDLGRAAPAATHHRQPSPPPPSSSSMDAPQVMWGTIRQLPPLILRSSQPPAAYKPVIRSSQPPAAYTPVIRGSQPPPGATRL